MPLPITEVEVRVALGAVVRGPETTSFRVRTVTLSAAPQLKVENAWNTPGLALDTVTVYWPVLGAATMVKGAPGAVKVQAIATPAAFGVFLVGAGGAAWPTPTAGKLTTLGITKTSFH